MISRPGTARIVGIGLTAGLLSGLFGIGGGVLVVPALVLLTSMPHRLATGTSVAAVLPMAASGVIGYAIHGEVDVPRAGCLALGAVAGAVLGASLLQRLPVPLLRWLFALLLAASAVQLVVDPGEPSGPGGLGVLEAGALVLLGYVSGVLAGMLGIGGGVLMVPALMLVFAVPGVLSKGTSLLVILPTSVMATWRNHRHDSVDLRSAAVIGFAGVAAAFAGSQLAVWLDPTVAAVLLAVLLAAVGIRLVLEPPERTPDSRLADSKQ